MQIILTHSVYTVSSRNLDPFYIVSYYIKIGQDFLEIQLYFQSTKIKPRIVQMYFINSGWWLTYFLLIICHENVLHLDILAVHMYVVSEFFH